LYLGPRTFDVEKLERVKGSSMPTHSANSWLNPSISIT